MALHGMREVAIYLRNGSLWVGQFIVGDGELDFGDDRFDAAHGLANLVSDATTRSTNEALAQLPTRNQALAGKTKNVPRVDAGVDFNALRRLRSLELQRQAIALTGSPAQGLPAPLRRRAMATIK